MKSAALLGGRPENLEAATLILAEMGYHGPQANPGKDSGHQGANLRQGENPDAWPSAAGALVLLQRARLHARRGREARLPSLRMETAREAASPAIGPRLKPGPKPSKQPVF